MNKKMKGCLIFLLLMFITIGAVSASEVSDDNTVVADDAPTTYSTEEAISYETSASSDNSFDTKTNKNIIKNNLNTKENVKSASNTHIVNNDTVDEIFNGTNFTLSDSINDGDILDFQGTIDKVHGLIVDKPVTIISSTEDAVISLHSGAGDRSGNPPPNSFIFTIDVSGSTISGLYLDNTECFIHNVYNAVFKNMTMHVKDAAVGNGIGQTALRYCNNVTMEDCYIYTENNGGSSSFVWTGCNNCTLINSTVEGQGNVGNILYVGNPYNIADKPANYTITNFDNNIINCTAIGGGAAISSPLQNPSGIRTLVKGNKFYSGGSVSGGTEGTLIDNEFYRTVGLSISANSVAHGNVFYGTGSATLAFNAANVQLYNNTFNAVNIVNGATSVFENNTVNGKLTVNKPINVQYNNLTDVQVNSNGKTSNITNNNVTGTITSAAANVTIDSNNITTSNEYTVVITGVNNTVTNNYLVTPNKAGNQTVSTTQTSTIIEDNTPESGKIIEITDDTYSQYFDENGKIKGTSISTYDDVVLKGVFNDKVFDFNNVSITIEGDNAVINNGYISSSETALLTVKNLIINNTADIDNSIIFESDENILRNVTIYRYSREGTSQEVYVTGNKNLIENNNFYLDVKTQPVDYSVKPSVSKVSAMTIFSNNNNVSKNNIYVNTTKNVYATFDAIDLVGVTACESNTITGNTIDINGTDYIYGINLGINTNKNTVTSNNIKLTSDTYTAGIQIMNGPSNNNTIKSNNINLTSDSVAYGILISAWENPEVAGNLFDSNKIDVTADQAYGMELYSSNPAIIIKNTTVSSNTIKSVGNYAMGIAFSGQESTIKLNTLNVTGTTSETMADSYDLIKPTTAGIILQDSLNIDSFNNTMNTTNGANHLLINTNDSSIMSSLTVRARYINAYGNVNIILNSSNNNIINTQKAFTDGIYSIKLIDSSENIIYNNDLNASNIIGGNYAVTQDTSSENNIIENNTVNKATTINYYVSDETGSDDNDGSQSAPFKTIAAAIAKTGTNLEFNIHILEGTYKGLGNTNLTVPGNYNINFIGSGINQTVIDGDAKFTIPGSGNAAWGGSAFWNNWQNVSGNWFMNITSGEGQFTVTNMTIQNCWSNSGSSIAACPTSTIDNRATLYATNVYFNKNHAGNGAGIRNNNGGTLYVDNCIFENGTKAQTTGNFGAAIYNNGTAIITNSYIINNYARWGSVTNDKNITMINCTLSNNHAYDGGSQYKNGPTFTADTGFADFYRMYAVYNLTSTIINCTFEDNAQCDISNGRGDLLVDNCVFNHSTGVYLFPNNNRNNAYIPTQNITNNQFIDMQPSTEFTSTLSSTTPSVAVRSLSPYPLLIENNTIDVKDMIYGYGLYLTSNATVYNNTLNNYIYVNNRDNIIDNNIIDTTKENTITLSSSAKNITITNNELYGGYTAGDLSISNIQSDTILENNIPVTTTYTINDENYATYFNRQSVLKTDVVSNGSKIILADSLTNKDFVFDNVKVSVDVTTTLYNTTIITQNNARVLFNNLKIDNAKTEEEYVILFESEGNIIRNGNINVTTDKAVQIIKVEEDGNIITGTTINATIPAADIIWSDNYAIGNVPSAGIFIRSSDNKVNNTKLYITALNSVPGSFNPTIDGIDIQSKKVGEFVTGNEIKNTRINITGGSYVYGLNIARAKETTTPTSWIDVTSNNYAVGIQIGDSDNNTISGYIYSKADNVAYGYYSTGMATGITNNTNISKLYIQGMQAPNATGVSIEGASNIEISSATYTINGENVIGIQIAPDYMGNKPENIIINNSLVMNLNGENDTSKMITITNASNIFINKTTIKSTSGTGITLTDTTNATVTNNYINVANLVGGDDAVYTTDSSTIFNNTPKIGVLTDETYSDFFDENNTLYVDVGIITLGGDLHDKVLRFDNHTKVINITNAANYTMYNSTFVLAGNGTYGDRFGFTVENINIQNVNKSVFIDEFDGTGQKNVKFVHDTIIVRGEDIVAFDALNNKSYVYLDISECNIGMIGKNVIAINYAGYNRGQPGYITENNIIIIADNKAIVYNAEYAAIQFNNNEVLVAAQEVVVANFNNVSISYYNFDENNITVFSNNAMILNMTKGDTYTTYISDNNITATSKNPATLINITGPKTVYVQGNDIRLDAVNGETPVISVNVPSSYVRNNYILARDMRGNHAVEDTGITISGNTPGDVITDETYSDFFDENGVLIPLFDNNDLIVSGDFVDNNVFIFDDVNVTFTSDGTAVFHDGQIWTSGNSTVTFDGLVFNNTMDAFVIESAGNTIKNTVINIDSDDEIHAIYIYENDNIIQNTSINIVAPSANVIYNPDYSVNTPAPAAIVVSANNTLIDGVDIYFDGREAIHNPDPTAWDAPTVDGIYLVSSNIPIENNTITDTSIEVIGCSYAYGINVGNAKNTKIEDIEVDVESDYYADAIQLFDADKISITGKANAAAESEAYGVYSTAMGTGFSKNIDLTGLDITTVAAKATGVLIEGSANVTMADATYTITGAETTAVRVAEDFMHNTPTNILIDNVEMDITGTEDNSVLDFYKADTVIITNNDIESAKGSEIFFNQTPNSQVVENYIKINDVIMGNFAVISTENDTIIENNTPRSQKMEEMQQTIDELQKELDELKAPKETTLTIDEITDARYKDNVTISGTLVNEDSIGLYNQIVTLTIDGKEVNVTTKGGVFEYTTSFKELGEKTVTATYAGTDKYQASEANTTFTVEKQDIIITYDPIQDAKYKDIINITGKITDINGNGLNNINALITINGKLYKAKTDKTGAFTLTTTITAVGTNTVKFAYNGNTNYNGYETTTTFNTEKQDITITYDAIPDAKYKDTITITGKFTDANGNGLYNINALIKINGKLYKAKTDKTGAFTLTIKANVTGTNNVNISYGGNTNYNGAETLTTFNVEKQDITIECDTIPETASGEDVTITGTVKDANGYSVNNVNVNIRINGKLFKAKTDTTGAFTLTTTATTVGTNNVTLSYNGNANYNTTETNTTFTVIAKP